MDQTAVLEPALSLEVLDRSDQEISVEVTGHDVLWFEANRKDQPADDVRVLPDPVLAFVAAARHGVFAHPFAEPWNCKAELLRKEVNLPAQKQSWLLRLSNMDSGAVLVLANMLQARVLDDVTIKAILPEGASASMARILGREALTFPRTVASNRFAVDYQPGRLSRERSVEITFEADAAPFADQVCAALEDWSRLLMLGGYPPADMRPYQSAAVAEPPFLADPQTIQMEFPDLFLCDEECFAALVNLTRLLHHTVSAVHTLVIR